MVLPDIYTVSSHNNIFLVKIVIFWDPAWYFEIIKFFHIQQIGNIFPVLGANIERELFYWRSKVACVDKCPTRITYMHVFNGIRMDFL